MANDSVSTHEWGSHSIVSFSHSTLYNKTSVLNGNSDFLYRNNCRRFQSNFTILLFARIIQALGSGIMMPLMMTTILDIFEPHERGKYMGIFGLVIGLAPAIGPTLSGYLVEYFNWRSLFHVVAPIAAITFIIALFTVKMLAQT